jgi:hypothetical protein
MTKPKTPKFMPIPGDEREALDRRTAEDQHRPGALPVVGGPGPQAQTGSREPDRDRDSVGKEPTEDGETFVCRVPGSEATARRASAASSRGKSLRLPGPTSFHLRETNKERICESGNPSAPGQGAADMQPPLQPPEGCNGGRAVIGRVPRRFKPYLCPKGSLEDETNDGRGGRLTAAKGWRDEDATEPKPTVVCRCGFTRWIWSRPSQRWVCASCGSYAKRASSGARS